MKMQSVSYRFTDKFDLFSFSIVLLLTFIGFAAIYSSTQNTVVEQANFNKQLLSWFIAIIVFTIIYFLPTQIFKNATLPAYFFFILLLIAVLLIGRKVGGARSWFVFGGLSFQPSEMAKLATIMAMSLFLSRTETNIERIKDILITLAIGLFPVLLIMLEPDLGSSITFFAIIIFMLFWKGISLFGLFFVLSPAVVAVASLFGTYYFIGMLGVIVICLFLFKKDIFLSGSIFGLNLAAGFFVDYIYGILSPHQQVRIKSFIDPSADPLGSGYNSLQAQIAIGSGGLFGKGFLSGNQTQLQFIPEQWTDFIFCVIGEEFGFVGSLIVIGLFFLLFSRILKIASLAKDEFFSLVIAGILSAYFIHFVINIGMAIGILPVIGIPLPFISYGGSSLITNMIMLGIIMNVYRTRKDYT